MELSNAHKFNNALCLRYIEKGFRPGNRDADRQTIQTLQKNLNSVSFKYNAVFNSADNCCVILDKHLNVVDYNYAALRLIKSVFGKKLNTGLHISGILNDDMFDPILTNCTRALSGDTFTVETQIACDTGATWWKAEYSPAYNDEHHIAGIVFNCVEITARKEHEAQIEEQNKRLKEIALIQSHNIRGPLCTLMGLMDLVKMEGLNGESKYLAMMDKTMGLLDSQIRAIIDHASEE